MKSDFDYDYTILSHKRSAGGIKYPQKPLKMFVFFVPDSVFGLLREPLKIHSGAQAQPVVLEWQASWEIGAVETYEQFQNQLVTSHTDFG